MIALVTGAAGFIGSTLVRELLKDDVVEQVIGVDSVTDYYDPQCKRRNLSELPSSSRFRFIEADLNVLDLYELLKNIDVVYHQAGQPGVRKSWGTSFADYIDNNIAATQKLLEAAKQSAKLSRFVYASSSSVYGNSEEYPTTEISVPRPYSPYGVTKLAAEHLVSLYAQNYGLPTVSLRYFTVYGPRQRPDMAMHRFIASALNGRKIELYGDGTQVRDFTFVDDVVNANILAGNSTAVSPGAVLNICGGSTVTVNDVLDTIGSLAGVKLQIVRTAKVAGDVFKTAGTNVGALREIGWAPCVSLEEGLDRHIRHLRASLI
ncbi:NAD-dependent epimerase/dehydratase family protein [Gordonia aquimaris]|uniref:NAD-dependent epimerase/dehydratase family protein n=1 Tax=Gordonia aquimaris TaxID=2984863 RepID=A0A9X3D5K0_9ACTN|nr:NAD-dependent epimerase/dehydratase family protein [Gordonia aquimaris]MCX2965388.1 NAD-dependent epimerase/dehydratase family protein [Gordonia aquimaris]